MAVLGIMAIIAFTVLGIVLEILQGQSGAASKNPVVVATEKYGDLHEFDLQRMRDSRRYVSRFLQSAILEASRGDGEFFRNQTLNYLLPLGLVAGNEQSKEALFSEQATVDHWLVVQRARELGLVASDGMVEKFLYDLTDHRLKGPDFAELFKRQGGSEELLFSALRDELVSRNYRTMVGTSLDLGTATPAQRWDYFQRLKRKIDLEVAPISVAQFVDDKEDPGDQVLEEFFEQYKNNFPSPESPEPGFRVPPTVEIEYVKAEFDKFADPASITDEEIKAYYDAHIEQFRNVELPGMDLGELPPAATGATDDQKRSEPSAQEGATPDAGPDAGKVSSEKPEAAPSQESEKKPDQTPADDPKGNEPSGGQTQETTSAAAIRSPFRLVAMSQEAEEDVEKAEPTVAAEEKPARPDADVPAEPEPKAPQDSSLALPELTPNAPSSEKSAEAEPAASTDKPALPEASAPKPKYKPLDEVKDQIRRTLAGEKVRDRILEGFRPIRTNMKKHHDKQIQYEVHKEEPGAKVEPPQIDLNRLTDPPAGAFWVKKTWKLVEADEAKTLDPKELVAVERFGPPQKTGLVTMMELAQVPIAASQTESEQLFLREAFELMPAFMPGISWDYDGNGYLYWKIREVEERVPKFDEEGMRDKVLAAWRFHVQAKKAALEHAQRLADEARNAGGSLADSIGRQPGVTVSQTGLFTWLTTGTLSMMPYQQPRLSKVEHVEMAGDAFMRAAYGLAVNEVGVAMNQPETTVYVMRLIKTTPLENFLMASFESEPMVMYLMVAQVERQKMINDWYADLRREADLKWERPADQPTRDEPNPDE